MVFVVSRLQASHFIHCFCVVLRPLKLYKKSHELLKIKLCRSNKVLRQFFVYLTAYTNYFASSFPIPLFPLLSIVEKLGPPRNRARQKQLSNFCFADNNLGLVDSSQVLRLPSTGFRHVFGVQREQRIDNSRFQRPSPQMVERRTEDLLHHQNKSHQQHHYYGGPSRRLCCHR